METSFPLQTGIAHRLLGLHATSCSTERNWSLWSRTCQNDRPNFGLRKVRNAAVQLNRALLCQSVQSQDPSDTEYNEVNAEVTACRGSTSISSSRRPAVQPRVGSLQCLGECP